MLDEKIERCKNCGRFILYIDSIRAWVHLAEGEEDVDTSRSAEVCETGGLAEPELPPA